MEAVIFLSLTVFVKYQNKFYGFFFTSFNTIIKKKKTLVLKFLSWMKVENTNIKWKLKVLVT